jgi:hypothetical protein
MTLGLMFGIEANTVIDNGARAKTAIDLTRYHDFGCRRVLVGVSGCLGDN